MTISFFFSIQNTSRLEWLWGGEDNKKMTDDLAWHAFKDRRMPGCQAWP
jgi:hypothetical protein